MSDYDFSYRDLDSMINDAAFDFNSVNDIDLSGVNLGGIDVSDINGLDLPAEFKVDPGAFSMADIDSMLNDASLGVGDFFDPSAPLLTPDGIDESIISGDKGGVGSSGYYDEITGKFIYDENGGLSGPLDETSGTNKESMDGYTYDKKTGKWTTPSGETYTPNKPPSHTATTGDKLGGGSGGGGTKPGGTKPGGNDGKGGGTSSKDNMLNKLLPLIMMMMMMNQNKGGGSSSSAVIPSLSADRKQLPYGPTSGSTARPGAGGTTYFSPTTYTQKAAGGGMMYGDGGISSLGGYSDGGRLLRGPGDGVSDSIPATIGGKQPARLAEGEFVVPARVVSELGNGSTDAGANKLYAMMDRVQNARRQTKNVAADTKAHKYLPA
jgi:hypothetical protein